MIMDIQIYLQWMGRLHKWLKLQIAGYYDETWHPKADHQNEQSKLETRGRRNTGALKKVQENF